MQLQDNPLVANLQLDTADEAMAGQTLADQLKDLEQVYKDSFSYAQMAPVTVSPASAREGDVRELMVANMQSVGITVARGEESSSGRQVRAAAFNCGNVTSIPKTECETLVNLYNSTQGTGWKDSATNNWLQTNTPCSGSNSSSGWTGVTCANGHVIYIVREAQNLVGVLPDDFSALTALRVINLNKNQITNKNPITGALSFPKFSNTLTLRELRMAENQLTGDLSDFVAAAQSKNLQVIGLGLNQLTGSIPDLSQLTGLVRFHVLSNKLTGPIPNLPSSLQSLVLAQNELTGEIPNLSASIADLRSLNLSNNRFTGTIPDLSKFSNLWYLRLANNQLTETIPAALSNLDKLEMLDVSRNQLTGQIPNLDKLTKLTDLGFQINQLEGAIPSLNTLVNLKNLALFNNKALCRDPQNNYAGRPEVVDATLFPICGKVTLSITKTGNGIVTGQDIDCGTDCINENLTLNTQVTLTAIAETGFAFQGWTGDCTGTEATTTITMDKTKTCTAAFELPVATGTGCDVVKEGLVACYPGDGNADDGSGNHLDGTIHGQVNFEDGVRGKAFQMGGSGYISVPHSDKLSVNYHTIAAWVSLSTGGAVVGKLWPGHYETLHLSAKGQKVATGFTTGTEMLNHPVSTTNYVRADGWHFVVLTYDGANVRFYIDGVLDTLAVTPRSGTVRTNTMELAIGRHCGDVEESRCDDGLFGGLIDEVRIYNRAISEAEVKQLYGLGTQPATVTLTVTTTGDGNVTASGIDCGTDCTEELPINTSITLTANALAGSTFKGWSGDCVDTNANVTLTMDKAKSCTATFDKVIPKYTLTVAKTGTGNLTGTGITCGTDCTEDYDANTQVTLTATPDTGSQFVSWGGDCSGTTTTATVSLDKAKNCVANFVPMSASYTLTVAKAGSGKGTIRAKVTSPINQNPLPPVIACKATCSTSSFDYPLNNVVTITAAPETGFTFKGWSCNGSYQTAKGNPTLIHVTIDAAKTCTATFQ
jgi:uncharacterized repeat protein (TIGR02543 family)